MQFVGQTGVFASDQQSIFENTTLQHLPGGQAGDEEHAQKQCPHQVVPPPTRHREGFAIEDGTEQQASPTLSAFRLAATRSGAR